MLSAGTIPEAGTELPPLSIAPTSLGRMVRWAAATRDFTEFHYDSGAAATKGFRGAVVHGPLKAAILANQLVTAFGDGAVVTKLSCRYRSPDIVGDSLVCHARVSEVVEHRDELRISCEIWTENSAGETTTSGSAELTVRKPVSGEEQAALVLITEEMRERYFSTEELVFSYFVSQQMSEEFATVVGAVGPAFDDETSERIPATLMAALDPFERKDIPDDGVLELVPYLAVGGGNAFTDVEYLRPLPLDQEITVVYRPKEIYERVGRAGRLLFRVRETEVRDRNGEVLARTTAGHAMAYDVTRSRIDG